MSHRTSVSRTTVVLAALVTALAPTAVLTGAASATGESASGGSTQVAAAAPAAPSEARRKQPVARGRGGAVSSVDLNASRIGLRILRRGGTAADAAIATAAALGVTEPYSAGIGGGGYFVYYDAQAEKVFTIDGREKAPESMRRNAFIDPETGEPYPFFPDLVTSGVAVGVPGTPLLMDRAINRFGNRSLSQVLLPAARLAQRGFRVDATFNLQTRENAERFRAIRPTRKLFLRGGRAPAVGSTFRNPDLARTYRFLARQGIEAFYGDPLGRSIVQAVRRPPKVPGTDLPVKRGTMTRGDLRRYTAPYRAPTKVRYRGLDVYGMPPSSSGGTTVGESLKILRGFKLDRLPRAQALHAYLETSALAFADRAAYVGDPAFVDVPVKELLSRGFAGERRCEIDLEQAAPKPVAAGRADGSYGRPCFPRPGSSVGAADTTGPETTHLSAADRFGNVASFTLTIEQTGGSGITVPGRGFLLNNELTDFSPEFVSSDPNRITGGKRPRSSMSPTIVLDGRRRVLALGSPGGSTIITTVLQTLVNRLDFGMSLPRAVAAPRASQRNDPTIAEQAFIDRWGKRLKRYGQELTLSGEPGTSSADIGAVAAVQLGRRGHMVAVAEPERRGGGSALVLDSRP